MASTPLTTSDRRTRTYFAPATDLAKTDELPGWQGTNAGARFSLGDVADYAAAVTLGLRNVVQAPMMILDLGTYGSPTFTGGQRSPQGGCVVWDGTTPYYFALMRVDGTTWDTSEKFRIVQFALATDGLAHAPIAYSEEIYLGHQPLSGYVEDGDIYLIAGMRPDGSYVGADAGKGYSLIAWRGALTDQTNVTNVPLFGLSASSHPFANLNQATPFLSQDGTLIHLLANSSAIGHASSIDDTAHILLTYRRADIEAAGDTLDVLPIYPAKPINGPPRQNAYFIQGGTSNGRVIYAARGYFAPFGYHGLQVFDRLGNLLGDIAHDDARGRYTAAELLDHATLGNPTSMEVEGVSFIDEHNLAVLVVDQWRTGCPIVSYGGFNYASIADSNLNNPPDRSPSKWVRTTKATTDGAWNAATTYGTGTVSRNDRIVYRIGPATGSVLEQPISTGTLRTESGATLRMGSNTIDLEFPLGDSWTAVAYSEQTGAQLNAFGFYSNGWRVYDLTFGADPTKYVYYNANFSGGRAEGQLRCAPEGLSKGAGINLGHIDDSDFPGWLRGWGTRADGSNFQGWGINPQGNSGIGSLIVNGLTIGTVAPVGIPRIVASEVVNQTVTGTTTETTVATLTNIIPANAIGTKGYIKITTTGYCSANDANTKFIRAKIAGTTVDRVALASALSNQKECLIRGAGATNAQVGRSTTIGSSYSSSTDATTSVSFAFDTTSALTVTFTIQNQTIGDSTTLVGYTIEVCYLP